MRIIRQNEVITRKSHQCFGCARVFPAGSRMESIVTLDDGHISRDYLCPVCKEYWDCYLNPDEDICLGDLKNVDPEGWNSIKEIVEGGNDNDS